MIDSWITLSPANHNDYLRTGGVVRGMHNALDYIRLYTCSCPNAMHGKFGLLSPRGKRAAIVRRYPVFSSPVCSVFVFL